MEKKVFISYSQKDMNQVLSLVKEIEERLNIVCWRDREDIEPGDTIPIVIQDAIDNCELVLFMYTSNSLASDYVRKEVFYATKTNKNVILVSLENLLMQSWVKFNLIDKQYVNIRCCHDKIKLYEYIPKILNGEPLVPSPHELVDLGLSVCWSAYNMCTLTFQKKIDYYVWGEENENGISTDVIRFHWGDGWRLPTAEEMRELKQKCRWEWQNNQQNKGYKVIGANGNDIFLPAAGYKQGMNVIWNQGMGCYWTDTLHPTTSLPCCLCFGAGNIQLKNYSRYLGFSIRPVYKNKL